MNKWTIVMVKDPNGKSFPICISNTKDAQTISDNTLRTLSSFVIQLGTKYDTTQFGPLVMFKIDRN